jgi:hypothetical protein
VAVLLSSRARSFFLNDRQARYTLKAEVELLRNRDLPLEMHQALSSDGELSTSSAYG